MRPYTRILLTVSSVLIAMCVWGQERSENPDLLARLSYKTSTVVSRDGVRQVCLAVSRDREYRIIRLASDGQTLRMRGKMDKEQYDRLAALLGSEKFRALSGNHGGLIRQDAETFAAEIPFGDRLRADGTREWMEREAWRLQWLNADGANPFPDAVAKIVEWLGRFQPRNGKEFEYAEFPDVCPSVGMQLVQPTIADNQRP